MARSPVKTLCVRSYKKSKSGDQGFASALKKRSANVSLAGLAITIGTILWLDTTLVEARSDRPEINLDRVDTSSEKRFDRLERSLHKGVARLEDRFDRLEKELDAKFNRVHDRIDGVLLRELFK
ncbi:hypothetical protein WJX73_009425 [Symbiochloris irregularis]|uniref:Uncharacterized protein n=1 Tax=Symbiochloris irregularis TaxID=706552 RepID=A0AAW1PH14_9CHLO